MPRLIPEEDLEYMYSLSLTESRRPTLTAHPSIPVCVGYSLPDGRRVVNLDPDCPDGLCVQLDDSSWITRGSLLEILGQIP